MAMQVDRWNTPDDGPIIGLIVPGKKHAFAKFSWETGDTYDPGSLTSDHSTTKPFNNGSTVGGQILPLAGKNPIDLWGIRNIDYILFDGAGSSDATVTSGNVKPAWIRNGQFIRLFQIGCTGTGGTLTAIDETELAATSGNLNALVLFGIIIGD